MTAEIPGGCTLWAKKVFQSPIFNMKPPIYFKGFFWIVGNAAFTDGYVFKGHVLKRGQMITTYTAFADALSYCFNRAIIKPSLKEIRIMLSWLQSEGMISVKPLMDGTLTNRGRHHDLTRAYVGLLITVLNFDTYQDYQSYRGTDKGRPSSEQGQLRKRKENIYINNMSDSDNSGFNSFYQRYPKHEGKKKALDAWKKINPDSILQDTILKAIERQEQHKANLKARNAFCPEWPLPATWLNGRRWEDEIHPDTPEPSLSSSPAPSVNECPRCGHRIVCESDFTPTGCVYCQKHENNIVDLGNAIFEGLSKAIQNVGGRS